MRGYKLDNPLQTQAALQAYLDLTEGICSSLLSPILCLLQVKGQIKRWYQYARASVTRRKVFERWKLCLILPSCKVLDSKSRMVAMPLRTSVDLLATKTYVMYFLLHGNGCSPQEHGSDWSWQHSALATTQRLQCDPDSSSVICCLQDVLLHPWDTLTSS